MPFVIRHEITGQVWTSQLTNSYKLAYYGTKNWDWPEDAEEQWREYLAGQSVDANEPWALFEVDEAQLKRYNVKLKNNPQLLLYVDEAGLAEIRKRAD